MGERHFSREADDSNLNIKTQITVWTPYKYNNARSTHLIHQLPKKEKPKI